MKEKIILDTNKIDNVTVSKNGRSINLYYEFDGKPVEVDGEFYIDKNGYLHHSHIDENGNEYLIKVLYFDENN